MLTVTEPAGAHLAQLLEEANVPDEAAVRFVLADQKLSLRVDSPKPGDETYEHNGRTVLLLDDNLSQVLSDKTLDLQQTEKGPALAVV